MWGLCKKSIENCFYMHREDFWRSTESCFVWIAELKGILGLKDSGAIILKRLIIFEYIKQLYAKLFDLS